MSSRHAFTVLELLVVIGVIVILAAIAFPVLNKAQAMKNEAICINNLRQIGLGISLYAGDVGKGEWGYYEALNITNGSTRGSWSSVNIWDTNYRRWNGTGKAYPYLKSRKVYICPNNQKQKSAILQLPTWEDAPVNLNASYVARGYDQSWISSTGETGNALGRRLGQVARRAVASCFFMNSPGNPNIPISWHDERWPVLYGDGSVKVIAGLPPKILLPAQNQNIWGTTSLQWRFWDHFDAER